MLYEDVYASLSHLSKMYPDFDNWFHDKVMPDINIGNRKIFTKRIDNKIVGVVIATRYPENKLNTLWVDDAHRNKGIGIRLMKEAFEWLGDDQPLLSIPSDIMDEMQSIVEKFGFKLTQTIDNHYREGITEFVYNGKLK